jgi:hypothetical protein
MNPTKAQKTTSQERRADYPKNNFTHNTEEKIHKGY